MLGDTSCFKSGRKEVAKASTLEISDAIDIKQATEPLIQTDYRVGEPR